MIFFPIYGNLKISYTPNATAINVYFIIFQFAGKEKQYERSLINIAFVDLFALFAATKENQD